MASAISIDGELFYESYVGGTNGNRYIEFLKHLMEKDNKNKIVIHDGLPSHRALKVKEYVESTEGKLKTYQLPGYSPELNPDELVWANLKKKLGKRAYKNIDELGKEAEAIMANLKSDKDMLIKYCTKIYGKSLAI